MIRDFLNFLRDAARVVRWQLIIAWRVNRKGLYVFRDVPFDIVCMVAKFDDEADDTVQAAIVQARAELKLRREIFERKAETLVARAEAARSVEEIAELHQEFVACITNQILREEKR
jgi:hypothetical protein